MLILSYKGVVIMDMKKNEQNNKLGLLILLIIIIILSSTFVFKKIISFKNINN